MKNLKKFISVEDDILYKILFKTVSYCWLYKSKLKSLNTNKNRLASASPSGGFSAFSTENRKNASCVIASRYYNNSKKYSKSQINLNPYVYLNN